MKPDQNRHFLRDVQQHRIRTKHGLTEPAARLIAELHFGGRKS